MVFRGHDRGTDVFIPDTCRPIPDGEKTFGIGRISLDGIDGTVMFACSLIEYRDTVVLFSIL